MNITQDSFRKDVENHEMKVLLDQGTHRHLRFQAPKTSNRYFEIVTFPGTLVYVGDMGSFVFQRVADMFQFFRSYGKVNLEINPSYWGEKLEAVDNRMINPGHKTYSEDRLRNYVREMVSEWCNREGSPEKQEDRLYRAVIEGITFDEGEHEAMRSVNNFSCTIDGKKFEFQDSWEWDCREYTGRFIWCCYALVWAIQQYDKQAEVQGGN